MTETLAYFLCVLGFAGFSYKLIDARNSQPLRRMWYMAGFGVCIAMGILVLTPAMEELAGGGEVYDRFATLAGDEFKLGAMAFAVAFVRSMRLGKGARLGWHAVLTFVTLATEAVLYLVAEPTRAGDLTKLTSYGLPFFVAYEVVFLVYGLISLVFLIVVFSRFAAATEPGPLRAGLWLIVAGVCSSFGWTFWDVDDVRQLAVAGFVEAREDVPSAVFAACSIGLFALGATLSVWSPSVSKIFGWFRAYRSYRRIEPLWTALRAAVPGIALDPDARLTGGAEFALYRRVIEIRDGHLALRRHFDPELPSRAEAQARAAGVPESRIAATVEAAALAAAILAERAGRTYPESDVPGPQLADADVATEAAWLVQVSRAFRRSEVVARVRADLASASMS